MSLTDFELASAQSNTAALIEQITKRNRVGILTARNDLLNLVWRNVYGLTPQQVCDSLGDTAARLFGMEAIIRNAINQIAAGTLTDPTPAGFTVGINPDGTATITQS